ncbi:hypothetical protein SAMN05216262_10965 [Colwellia chukchiensis]|uniref:Anti-sigma factor n=1 Tax=Colwellia chukchiensis TaxID=641665 RepID=A0A1H7PBM9_9GAMM|nr:hypothetical protein [Colwellia chukchiensis]SEL33210.1 hypothetical protein SAMN05216262_10965 [Colwellia chukchiensis]
MNISDEMLSGFIDAELSEEDMEIVRLALETDDELVMRLADLAQADQWVAEHAAVIDQTPIPTQLVHLAQAVDRQVASAQVTEPTSSANNVVRLSHWRNVTKHLQKHVALAAGIAMVFGVGTVTLMQSQQPSLLSAGVIQALEQTPSGTTSSTATGVSIVANLSFTDHGGHYCRQFQHQNEQSASINIACKEGEQWQLKASKAIALPDNNAYRTASHNGQLDDVIDTLISGEVMDRTQEQHAINNNWQNTQHNQGE